MATQTVMDHTGDTRHIFDATDEDAVSMSAENEADYRSRGRRLERLADAALRQRWIKCLRRVFKADRLRRVEMDDISAELSLRGITSVKLPRDVLELVTADFRKLIRREREVSGQKFN